MLASDKHNTLENTRSLQVASRNNDGTTHMYGCKCSFKIAMHRKQNRKHIYQIHCICTIHGCKCSCKINTVPNEEWVATATFTKLRNTVLWAKLFLVIKYSKLKEKMCLWSN